MKQPAQKSTGTRSILAIAGLAIVGGYLIATTGPQTQPEESQRPPKMVATAAITPSDHQVHVRAFGTVTPVRRVEIAPEVTGLIIRHHPNLIPGGVLREGDELFAIDPTIMELSAKEATASVRRAETMLAESRRKEAEAQQLSAERVIAQSDLAAIAAEVQIQAAELDRLRATEERIQALLFRHSIRAPFNAIVLNESVEIGQRVNPGFAAATLVGADRFWVNAALPVDQLQWIQLPNGSVPGAAATVFLDTGGGDSESWEGRVIQLLSDVEREGRMARLLIQVDDPLSAPDSTAKTPLLIGSYVRVEIDAGTLSSVLAIDRKALRDGNRIWIADANDQLQIKQAKVRWRAEETVYIDNALADGESLITSPLRAALPGMKIQARPSVE